MAGHHDQPDRGDINSYEQWLTVPGATVHLYGKGPPRPGQKMGHVTQVGTSRQKRLIGAKSADLASQSGRNWLSAGGQSRLWLIKSAPKDKGSAFRQPFALPEFQSDQLKRMPRAGSRSR
jgi:hypothetical protein